MSHESLPSLCFWLRLSLTYISNLSIILVFKLRNLGAAFEI